MTTWTNSSLAAERDLRTGVRTCLTDWATLALAPQQQVPARHHRVMIAELEAVAAGTCDRLMLLLPPGHAKSTYASLLFPAWFLAQHPSAHVICASHTAELATAFGRGVRSLIGDHRERLGIGIDPASRAANRFGTKPVRRTAPAAAPTTRPASTAPSPAAAPTSSSSTTP